MKNLTLSALLILSLIFVPTGCKVVKAIGESIGIIDETSEESRNQPVPNPNKPSIVVTTGDSGNYSTFLVWGLCAVVVLFGIKYGLEKWLSKRNE